MKPVAVVPEPTVAPETDTAVELLVDTSSTTSSQVVKRLHCFDLVTYQDSDLFCHSVPVCRVVYAIPLAYIYDFVTMTFIFSAP